jgi:hypothetical protein
MGDGAGGQIMENDKRLRRTCRKVAFTTELCNIRNKAKFLSFFVRRIFRYIAPPKTLISE